MLHGIIEKPRHFHWFTNVSVLFCKLDDKRIRRLNERGLNETIDERMVEL
jgi:hypothetical protein